MVLGGLVGFDTTFSTKTNLFRHLDVIGGEKDAKMTTKRGSSRVFPLGDQGAKPDTGRVRCSVQ